MLTLILKFASLGAGACVVVIGVLGVLVCRDKGRATDVARSLSLAFGATDGVRLLTTNAETSSPEQSPLPQQTQPETPQSRNIKTVSKVVADYHKAHTYIGRDIYVCGDMASDVWNMLITRGINAKIMIGDVEKDISSALQANHAWVMAEVSPGEWLAVETTGGFVVYPEGNSRYYQGHWFSTPKELRTYSNLHRDFALAKHRYNEAWVAYEPLGNRFKSADMETKLTLLPAMNEGGAVVDQRIRDMVKAELALKQFCGE